MWLNESQIQFIVEALIPPELKQHLDKEEVSHLVDRHDAMYLASRNTQYPDTEGQHEWRITALGKGVPEGRNGGVHNVSPNYHYSYKDPAVAASYMKKIHSAPEHWGLDDVHDMLKSHNGPEGRRGGWGERLYDRKPEPAKAPKEDDAFVKDGMGWLDNFDDNMAPYEPKKQNESYLQVVNSLVSTLLESNEDTTMVVADNFYVTRLMPHMPIHKRNKIATVLAGAVGNTP